MINQTAIQFDEVIAHCRSLFVQKNLDYGQSWRIMRISSIMDQIYIKAIRIRNIEELGVNKVGEDVNSEWVGILNYCIMGLIQCETSEDDRIELSPDQLKSMYDGFVDQCKQLMAIKNHDYGEIWRKMLVSTYTDMILVRVNRMQQILVNKGKTLVSEGIESNLMDMINYAVFALIRLNEIENNNAS